MCFPQQRYFVYLFLSQAIRYKLILKTNEKGIMNIQTRGTPQTKTCQTWNKTEKPSNVVKFCLNTLKTPGTREASVLRLTHRKNANA